MRMSNSVTATPTWVPWGDGRTEPRQGLPSGREDAERAEGVYSKSSAYEPMARAMSAWAQKR